MNHDYILDLSKIETNKNAFSDYQSDFDKQRANLVTSNFATCSNAKVQELSRVITDDYTHLNQINTKALSVWESFVSEMTEKENALASFSVSGASAPTRFEEEIEPVIKDTVLSAMNGDVNALHDLGRLNTMLPSRKTGKENYVNDALYKKWAKYYAKGTIWCTGYVAARVEEGTGHVLPTDLGNANNWPKNAHNKYGYNIITNIDDVQAGDPVSLIKGTSYHIIVCEGRDENGTPLFSDGHTTRHAWGTLHPISEWTNAGWKWNNAVDVHGVVNGEYELGKKK